MQEFRSLLFVPGPRPDRFPKAVTAGADAVCIDLEDAVAPAEKSTAREATLDFLAMRHAGPAIGFRINALSTIEAWRDLVAFAESAAIPAFMMIPRTRSCGDLHRLREALGERCPPLWPLLEGPDALAALSGVAEAAAPDGGVMLGGVDCSSAIGADTGWDGLYHVRASLVAATSAAGGASLNAPYISASDLAGLEAETRRVPSMGFGGRAAIHPSQAETIDRIFTPDAGDLSRAEKVAAAFANAGGGIALVGGALVEKPVEAAARRIIARRNDRT
jgi:citrate lyase subunit beta/citryl-CoA lyase/(S)-citramalyl-CoA lyase